MPHHLFPLAVLALGLNAAATRPPIARRIPHPVQAFGETRTDDYYWLRDRTDPQVIEYLEAENAYTKAMLAPTEGLQEKLYEEMVSHIRETDESVPERDGPWRYYSRTEQGKQYPIWCRRALADGAPEVVLLDGNALATGHAFMRIGAFAPSPDHARLAYSIDTTGAETYEVLIKDLATGQLLPDRVPGVDNDVEWADDHTLFYTVADSAKRPYVIRRHVLGTPAANDVEVFREPDELFNLELRKSHDRRWLIAHVESFSTSEEYLLPADRPTAPFRVVEPRRHGVQYEVLPHGDRLFVLTNDGATNFRVMAAPVASPGRASWTPLVPESRSMLLEDAQVFRRHLVLLERGEARRALRIVPLEGGDAHEVAVPESVYALDLVHTPEYDSNVVRFAFESPITPQTTCDYDMTTRARTVLKRREVPNYDPSHYRTARTWAKASDGTPVPISLVWREPLVRNGARPLLLYGYGSYGISSDPRFNSNLLGLLDRGFVYAIAHVRGGQEMGRPWYDAGKLANKTNTFTDFIACAEHLVHDHWTSSDRLAIRGGSAGGLLMGAVMNLRPDLFRAVVADVPFVDVMNTMTDPTIPLTTQEWEQWGDPRQEADYRRMRAYSPYDNVTHGAYPALLVTAGLNDPRVGYWEPAKWVAKQRALRTDHELLVLRTHMGAGHGGSSGRYDNLREQAIRQAFVIHALGLDAESSPTAAPAP